MSVSESMMQSFLDSLLRTGPSTAGQQPAKAAAKGGSKAQAVAPRKSTQAATSLLENSQPAAGKTKKGGRQVLDNSDEESD
jgi:hypothetical protein